MASITGDDQPKMLISLGNPTVSTGQHGYTI